MVPLSLHPDWLLLPIIQDLDFKRMEHLVALVSGICFPPDPDAVILLHSVFYC